jgi:hypothetical protein
MKILLLILIWSLVAIGILDAIINKNVSTAMDFLIMAGIVGLYKKLEND